MSRKFLIIGGVVIAVLAIGGLAYWRTSAGGGTNTAIKPSSNEVKNSILGISGGGAAQECTMNYSSSSGSGTGKIYTDGNGQGRYIFTTKSEQGNTGEVNQVLKDKTAYAWVTTNGKTIGFKINTESTNSGSTSSSSSGSTGGPSLNDNFDMNCQPWTVDTSKFEVPSDINFLDASALNPLGN